MANCPEGGIKIGKDILLIQGQTATLAGASFLEKQAESVSRVLSSVQPSFTIIKNPAQQAVLSIATSKNPVKVKQKRKSSENVKKQPKIAFPLSRIRLIMKTSPNISFLSQDTVSLTAKAAELFVRKLVHDSFQDYMSSLSSDTSVKGSSSREIKYSHLVNAVHKYSSMEFLKDFVPTKMSGRECQRLVGNRTQPHPPQDKDEAMDKEMNLSQKNILTSSDGVQ